MSELTNGLVPQLQERIKQLEFQLQAKEAYTEALIETMQVAVDGLNSHIGLAYNFPKVYSAKELLEKTVSRHKLTISKPAQTPAAAPVQDAPRFKVGDKVLAAKLVVPQPVTKLVWHRGEWCYELDDRAVLWSESELEAYSESEKERHVPDMPSATPPAPRFKVGDKVRIKQAGNYKDALGEVIQHDEPFTDAVWVKLPTLGITENFWPSELEAYSTLLSESESK